MSEFEFPTMGQIWLAQQPRGAKIRFLDGTDNQVPTEAYTKAVDKRTKIVPLTAVSFVNGSRSDVPAITRIAHDNGALLFLDGYQDCGTRPIDVKALGARCRAHDEQQRQRGAGHLPDCPIGAQLGQFKSVGCIEVTLMRDSFSVWMSTPLTTILLPANLSGPKTSAPSSW